MPKSVIIPRAPAPRLPFVPGTTADGVVYVSGTLPFDAQNNVVFPDDPKAQTRHVLQTIQRVIETAGGTMEDVTFNSIFITDWKTTPRLTKSTPSFSPAINRRASAFSAGWSNPTRWWRSPPSPTSRREVAMNLSISPPPFPGAPVVVLIAGLGGSASYWLPQLAELEQGYQVVCYDQRGTGNNPGELPEEYSPRRWPTSCGRPWSAQGSRSSAWWAMPWGR